MYLGVWPGRAFFVVLRGGDVDPSSCRSKLHHVDAAAAAAAAAAAVAAAEVGMQAGSALLPPLTVRYLHVYST